MYLILQKSNATGRLTSYFHANWDMLKANLISEPEFPTELFDRHFGWENLQNSTTILNDGDYLYQMWDESRKEYKKDWWEGDIIFLSEIDPIFD